MSKKQQVKKFKYNCVPCDFHHDNPSNYQHHLDTKKHEKLCGVPEEDTRRTYQCDLCGYGPTKSSTGYNIHCKGDGHKLKVEQSKAPAISLPSYTHANLCETLLHQFQQDYKSLVSYFCVLGDKCKQKPCELCMPRPLFEAPSFFTYLDTIRGLFSFLQYTHLKYDKGCFVLNGAIINISVAHFLVGLCKFVDTICLNSIADALKRGCRENSKGISVEFRTKIKEIANLLDSGKEPKEEIITLAHTLLSKQTEIDKAKELSKQIKVTSKSFSGNISITDFDCVIPKNDLDEDMRGLALCVAVKNKAYALSASMQNQMVEQSQRERATWVEPKPEKKGPTVLNVADFVKVDLVTYDACGKIEEAEQKEEETEEEEEEEEIEEIEEEECKGDNRTTHYSASNKREDSEYLVKLRMECDKISDFIQKLIQGEDGIIKRFFHQKATTEGRSMALSLIQYAK